MASQKEMKFKRRPWLHFGFVNKWSFWRIRKRESSFWSRSQLSCSDRKKVGKNESRKRKYFPDIGYSGRKEPWTIPLHNSSTSVYIVKALNIYIVATTAAAFRVMVLLFHSKEGIHKKDAFQEFPSLEKKRGKPKT